MPQCFTDLREQGEYSESKETKKEKRDIVSPLLNTPLTPSPGVVKNFDGPQDEEGD